jgi:hypothetical protein
VCGIFGAIGRKINSGVIRALAIANRERGVDGLGFFNNTGKHIKLADDPLYCLTDPAIDDFIERSCLKGWFIAGHTRAATCGSIVSRNAHPFRFGRIIGSHNGIVQYPRDKKYHVDSEYIFDRLNQHGGDYQAALEEVIGYWAISWFDGENFYLQAYKNKLWIGRKNGVWYYSSDLEHLTACAGNLADLDCIESGRTIRFDMKTQKYKECPAFQQTKINDNLARREEDWEEWENWSDLQSVASGEEYIKEQELAAEEAWQKVSTWEMYVERDNEDWRFGRQYGK